MQFLNLSQIVNGESRGLLLNPTQIIAIGVNMTPENFGFNINTIVTTTNGVVYNVQETLSEINNQLLTLLN